MKKNTANVSNPDELNKYLQNASPVTWIIIFLVVVIIAGFFAWSFLARIKVRITGNASISSHVATLHVEEKDLERLEVGQVVTINNQEGKILSFNDDKTPVVSSFTLDDGEYTYSITVREIRPIDFFIGK